VLGSDGCIYAIPSNASRVLRIDPAAPRARFIPSDRSGK
jgi:hypothetical protein